MPKQQERPSLTSEELLRRMLTTPPKPHAEMVEHKPAKKPRKRVSK